MNSVSDECTSNSCSHKKPSFSQNPTAQKLNGLEMTICRQNLGTYLFVSGLFALVHIKSSSMTVSTNHDNDNERLHGAHWGKEQTKPSNISDKKILRGWNLNHIRNKIEIWFHYNHSGYTLSPSGIEFYCKNSTVLLENLMCYSTQKP